MYCVLNYSLVSLSAEIRNETQLKIKINDLQPFYFKKLTALINLKACMPVQYVDNKINGCALLCY